jgi:hypothetical protein
LQDGGVSLLHSPPLVFPPFHSPPLPLCFSLRFNARRGNYPFSPHSPMFWHWEEGYPFLTSFTTDLTLGGGSPHPLSIPSV